MFPIYIPSKGRAGCLRTAALLNADCLDYLVVVEPQESEAYQDYPVLVLPEDNQGLAYSRQFIKCHSKSQGEKWHWQLDDDIKSFVRRGGELGYKQVSAKEALSHIEENVLRFSNIGQAGTNQNSWPPGPNAVRFNHLPVQAVLNNNATSAKYRSPELLEDFDYTLQVLTEGWCNIMFDWVRTNTPKISSIPGGLQSVYQSEFKIFKAMQSIAKDFPTMSISRDTKGWHLNKNRIFSTFKQKPILASKSLVSTLPLGKIC